MDYMESIKKLEEKWVSNYQKNGSNGFSNGTNDREVKTFLHALLFFPTLLGPLTNLFEVGVLDMLFSFLLTSFRADISVLMH